MRLSLGGVGGIEGEGDSEGGSDVGVSWVAGFAGSLPVVSWVLVSNSLIINDVSFSDKVELLANVASAVDR